MFYLVSRADCGRGHTLCVWTGHSGTFCETRARIFWNKHNHTHESAAIIKYAFYQGCFLSPRSAPHLLKSPSL